MRRKLLLLFFVGSFIVIAASWQNFLYPLFYRIKEPYFKIPIKFAKFIKKLEDLPIRADSYGNGLFGSKRSGNRRHDGIDLTARFKTPVYASKSGWARYRYFPRGYGHLIIISHPGGWETRYGHLHTTNIKDFQWVRQGDIIGSVGKTGNANFPGIAPHLHFEIRHKGKIIDPTYELVKKEVTMRKYMFLVAAALILSLFVIGCGETISGVGKDVKRVGKGIKTVFFKDE